MYPTQSILDIQEQRSSSTSCMFEQTGRNLESVMVRFRANIRVAIKLIQTTELQEHLWMFTKAFHQRALKVCWYFLNMSKSLDYWSLSSRTDEGNFRQEGSYCNVRVTRETRFGARQGIETQITCLTGEHLNRQTMDLAKCQVEQSLITQYYQTTMYLYCN